MYIFRGALLFMMELALRGLVGDDYNGPVGQPENLDRALPHYTSAWELKQ